MDGYQNIKISKYQNIRPKRLFFGKIFVRVLKKQVLSRKSNSFRNRKNRPEFSGTRPILTCLEEILKIELHL